MYMHCGGDARERKLAGSTGAAPHGCGQSGAFIDAVELLAPWAASDACYLHPAPSVRTERGAGKRYFAFTLRLADEPGSGGVASSERRSGAVELLAPSVGRGQQRWHQLHNTV
jgi:hypothetical protein